MANFATIGTKVTADTSDFTSGIKDVNNTLKDQDDKLNKTTSAQKGFSRSTKKTGRSLNRSSKKMKKFGDNAGLAQSVLFQFTAGAQDAQFGMAGMLNNLDPMISGFGTLQRKSGGLKGALSAVGSVMMGPAGIATLGVTAATILVQNFDTIKGAIIDTESRADSLGETLDDVIKSRSAIIDVQFKFGRGRLDSIVGGLESELEDLRSRRQEVSQKLGLGSAGAGMVARSDLSPQEISELKKEYRELGGEIDQLSATLEPYKDQLDEINQRQKDLEAAGLVPKMEKAREVFEEVAQETNTLRKKMEDGLITPQEFAAKRADMLRSSLNRLYDIDTQFKKGNIDGMIQQLLSLLRTAEDAQSKLNTLEAPSVEHLGVVDVPSSSNIQSPFDGMEPPKIGGDDGEPLVDTEAIAGAERMFGQKLPKSINATNDAINIFRRAKNAAFSDEARERYQAYLNKLLRHREQMRGLTADQVLYREVASKSMGAVNELLGETVNRMTSAILRGESLKKAFKGFGDMATNVLQDVISHFTTAIAKAAVLKGVLSIGSSIFGGGFGSILGFGKEADTSFGGIFKSVLGFADGGIVTRPTLGVIGEGMEPEIIAPQSDFMDFAGKVGGGQQNIIVELAPGIRMEMGELVMGIEDYKVFQQK